ncbi:hypothetical protein WG954_05450 [Lacibacter sp. H375]|uniref:hypothetical protein n=1 Tax=Lacibacter sp. H375 TaxID=3133424 RepID=UPI0030BE176F
MTAFITDKPLLKHQFFLQIACSLISYLVILGVLLLFFPHKSNNAPYLFYFFLLVSIVRLMLVDRVQEIRFDEDNKELHFYSKGYLTKLRKMKTSFENMHVKKEDWESKSKWLPKRKILSVEILKEKTLVFTVNMNLDHFSEHKMRDLISTFEANNIPVK